MVQDLIEWSSGNDFGYGSKVDTLGHSHACAATDQDDFIKLIDYECHMM